MTATLNRNPNPLAGFGRGRAGWTHGRRASVLAGSVLGLCSLGLVAVGGYALTAATSHGGWVDLGHSTYATDTYAVASDPQDWATETYLLGAVDKVRIRVTPSDATTPVFVGMARTDDIERYLGGIKHVIAHDGSGNHVTYTQHDGQAPTTPPGHAIPWTAQVTGTGTQTLEFDAQQHRRDEVAVVMNADGSRSMNGRAESTVTQPSLPWIGSGMLAGGVVLGIGAVLLVVRPVRRAQSRG